MKSHIQQLYTISKKSKRRILGLMSGTSLDGLDLALCIFSGSGKKTKVQVEKFATAAYSNDFKEKIKKIFAKQTIDFQELTLLNIEVAEMHATLVLQTLAQWKIDPKSVDVLASHGQTVFHAPQRFHQQADRPNATLQIGDGDHLAVKTDIFTLSDFRQKHLAMGGEGAPLALYGDAFLFSKKGRNRFLLNIGGIANFTFLPADEDFSKAFATDTGPGNTLMDFWAKAQFGEDFDKGARIANGGVVEHGLLGAMLAHPFFSEKMPKTTGPELFGAAYLQTALDSRPKGRANPFNVMATLVELTALSVTDTIKKVPLAHSSCRPELYFSGGGAHNPLLVARIKALLPGFRCFSFEKLGFSGDAKEAVLFALLANETLCGKVEEEAILGGLPMFGMGKISLPK